MVAAGSGHVVSFARSRGISGTTRRGSWALPAAHRRRGRPPSVYPLGNAVRRTADLLLIGDREGRALALVNIVMCARAELGQVETAAHLDEALAQARSVGCRWLEDAIVLERDGLSPSGGRG